MIWEAFGTVLAIAVIGGGIASGLNKNNACRFCGTGLKTAGRGFAPVCSKCGRDQKA